MSFCFLQKKDILWRSFIQKKSQAKQNLMIAFWIFLTFHLSVGCIFFKNILFCCCFVAFRFMRIDFFFQPFLVSYELKICHCLIELDTKKAFSSVLTWEIFWMHYCSISISLKFSVFCDINSESVLLCATKILMAGLKCFKCVLPMFHF